MTRVDAWMMSDAWKMSAVRMISLDALPLHQLHNVAKVNVPGVLGDRLVELGFTPGAPVQLLRRAPFGGPLQVQVRDFVVSLRRNDAQAILTNAA